MRKVTLVPIIGLIAAVSIIMLVNIHPAEAATIKHLKVLACNSQGSCATADTNGHAISLSIPKHGAAAAFTGGIASLNGPAGTCSGHAVATDQQHIICAP